MPRSRLFIETTLKDGTPVCLRTIRPSDEDRLREGIKSLSDESRYLRFFSAFRDPPPDIVRKLSAVDGHDHIGWGAVRTDLEAPLAIGAAHAIRSAVDPEKGELAIGLLDAYHRQGLARMLIALVLFDCLDANMPLLEMDVIGENRAAIALVTALEAVRSDAPDVVDRYQLCVATAIERLRNHRSNQGLNDVFAAR